MTYDLKVILKCCGRSSHEVLGLCGWSWLVLGASVGGFGPLLGPLCAVLAPLGALGDAKSPPRAAKTAHAGPKSSRRAPTDDQEVMGRSPTILQDDFEIIGHRKVSHNTPR